MKFEFDSIELAVILSALRQRDTPMCLPIWRKLTDQMLNQTHAVAFVAKDPTDDGPEVNLLRFFQLYSGGAHWPTFSKLGETPLETTDRLRLLITRDSQ